MNPDHLIALAREGLQIGGGTPNLVMINRSISTAYYALFHALCWEVVDRTVGRARPNEIVTSIYRSLQHGTARSVFATVAKDQQFPELLRQVSLSFIELQEARTKADYDPGFRSTRRQAQELILQAEQAIKALRAAPMEDRLILAVKLITKQR